MKQYRFDYIKESVDKWNPSVPRDVASIESLPLGVSPPWITMDEYVPPKDYYGEVVENFDDWYNQRHEYCVKLAKEYKENNMITEDYVSFETAKLLKEKGFDGECDLFVRTDETELIIREASKIAYNQGIDDECVILPTLQMAMKWLREVHNIFISIVCCTYPTLKKTTWTPEITTFESVFPDSAVECDTYEQACEIAVKYCLENLI